MGMVPLVTPKSGGSSLQPLNTVGQHTRDREGALETWDCHYYGRGRNGIFVLGKRATVSRGRFFF